jgi:hypothetical protein
LGLCADDAARGTGGTMVNLPGLFVVVAALIAAVASAPWF